jgi:Tfp pilus assembly protein FimT
MGRLRWACICTYVDQNPGTDEAIGPIWATSETTFRAWLWRKEMNIVRETMSSANLVLEPKQSALNLGGDRRATVARKRRSAGFTMMEVAIVISIVMVLLAFGIPSMLSTIDTYKLNSAATSASWAIQTTRYQALMKGYPYQLTFSTANNTFQVASEPPGTNTFTNVGVGVPITAAPVTISANAQLQFKGNGSVTPVLAGSQTFTITYKGRTKTITVSNYGSVTIQ